MSKRSWRTGLALAPFGRPGGLPQAAAATPAPISSIDLTGPFGARSPWRFLATQGPEIDDPTGVDNGDKAPGAVVVCLRKAGAAQCDPSLKSDLRPTANDDMFSAPHYLIDARIVHRRDGQALLLVQTGSLLSGDSDQLVLTQLLAYDRASDSFRRVFQNTSGHNNNQAFRFVENGPLDGDVITAEPTSNAPFAFWVTVSAPASAFAYKQVLRYRSATIYADGNPLSVVDSEMPNIQQRLGVWRPGSPLPLPSGGCAKPHLVKTELWCK